MGGGFPMPKGANDHNHISNLRDAWGATKDNCPKQLSEEHLQDVVVRDAWGDSGFRFEGISFWIEWGMLGDPAALQRVLSGSGRAQSSLNILLQVKTKFCKLDQVKMNLLDRLTSQPNRIRVFD